ncbi:MAG: hypothetical protein IKJ59_14080 [Clostridia bacterium]|nr:hypothetical protein [Clostridia bacterium]
MKNKRPKRKVVLVLVEGQSEINALKPAISALFDSINPEIEVFFPTIVEDGCDKRGDITSKYGISADVIEGCIYKLFLKSFFDTEKLYPKDVTEIIQLVDLDGAYIPNDQIIFGENPNGEEKPYYGENGILTTDVESMVERNKRKQGNLNYLSSISEIQVKSKRPKYSIYFFSSNLDHFIHGDANLSVRDKTSKAEEFAARYELDPVGFTAVIKATPGALQNMSYDESWNFIKESDNSIKRYSNINILLDRLLSQIENGE